MPASAGARSESSAASAASPWEKVAEWVGKLGSDRKQSSKKAEWDASVRPATIADPRGSDVSDISAETSGSAETTDAAGAVARPRSSDDGRASHASVDEDAVGSSCADAPAPRATPAESKPLASTKLSVPAAATAEERDASQTQAMRAMQEMMKQMQTQAAQVQSLGALVQKQQQQMQELRDELAKASSQQGMGPEPYEIFKGGNGFEDYASFSTPNSSDKSDSPPQKSGSAPSSAAAAAEPNTGSETDRSKHVSFDAPSFMKTATRSDSGAGMGVDDGSDVMDDHDLSWLHKAALLAALGVKAKKQTGKTMWAVTWTTGSTHPALKSFDTTVDKQFAFDMAPSPGDKQMMIELHKSLDPDSLLKAFHDGMLQSTYVEERQRLATDLYTLACTAESHAKV